MTAAVPRGRTPVQARAVARVEAILDAAGALLVDGSDALTMTAVAARARAPIGSLYQYFPGRSSLLLALAERHLRSGQARLLEDLAATPGSPLDGVERALRRYLDLADDPLAVAIMALLRSDPDLRALDRADTRANAALVLAHLGATGTPEEVAAMALVIDLAGHLVIDLAGEAPPARAAQVDAFVRLARGAVPPRSPAAGP